MCPGGNSPCSGHGTCGAWDTCSCYRNWQEADCSMRTCPYTKAFADIKDSTVSNRGEHYYAECGNKGFCDRKSGECQCFDGFEGSGCDRMSCPDNCNGHGTCDTLARANNGYSGWDAEKIQVCNCDPGYTGASCADRKCKLGDDPLTLQTISTLDYQVDEEQTITFSDSGGTTAITGEFTITYQDWRGESWTTRAIDIATATSTTIKEALVALPNNAIPSVTVTSTGSAVSGTYVFTVTFDSDATPGNQPALTIDVTACTTAGCQPVLLGIPTADSTVAVAELVAGTEERAECSSRGLCNTETGTCECYAGYYGEACHIQTVIT